MAKKRISKAPKARKAKAVKAKAVKAEGKDRRPDGLRKGSAAGLLVDAVCKPSGATHAELREVVKWKQCLPYMLKSAAQAGVRLKKEREEGSREVRYYGTPARG